MNSQNTKRWPLMFYLYRWTIVLVFPLLLRFARRRHLEMKCEPSRFTERLGLASQPRPQDRLIWINASSLGELRAVIALIVALPNQHFLITTTTQSGADMVFQKLPQNCIHQFIPLDTRSGMTRFLDHWHPELALFVESDLPLSAIDLLARRHIPMGILNTRPSRTRTRFPRLIGAVLSRMSLVTSQDEMIRSELIHLGLPESRHVAVVDLKTLAPPPKPDPIAVTQLRNQISGRPTWLVMSAHPEEASVLFHAHRLLLETNPDLILCVAPRHPGATDRFEHNLNGLTACRRSKNDALGKAQVYFADTLGETGTLFAIASFTVIGGTFADIGGHSPAEALMSGLPVLHGPYPGNHLTAFSDADNCGAGRMASNAQTLASAVSEWLNDDILQTAVDATHTLVAQNDNRISDLAGKIEQLVS